MDNQNTKEKPSPGIQLSFITLTWNSEAYIKGYIESVASLRSILDIELIVVDNGSTDATVAIVNELMEEGQIDIILIPNKSNTGTTYSRNQGLAIARGEYFAITDSDVEFDAKGFRGMIKYLSENPYIGIIAPRLRLGSGEIQQSIKPIPLFSDKIAQLFRIISKNHPIKKNYYDLDQIESPCTASTAISAFWLLPRATLDNVGFLDEKIFYSPEDIDFSLRCWLNGRPIVYYPDFEAIHYTQQITHQSPFTWISFTHMRDLIYFFWKYKFLNDSDYYEKMIKNVSKTFNYVHIDQS